MLVGATQRSDSDPYDKTSPPITVGPHWMIMWPFARKPPDCPQHTATKAHTPCGWVHPMRISTSWGTLTVPEISERMWPHAAFTWGSQS
jgi:hypothetical protein